MKMKKTLSMFLAIINILALFCMPVQAADVDVSQYGSPTYTTAYYVPSGSGDSSIAYEQSGNGTETGGYILTYSKASSATSVPAGTLITGAGGGLGNVLIANDTYGAKTFHSRYTFVESSSPILMQFQHKSSSATLYKDTFTMSNDGVSFGNAYVATAAPYDINIFQNVYTGETVIYVNDTVLIDQRGTGETLVADGATYWHKLNFKTTLADSAFRLVLKNIRHMVYTTDVTLTDVVDYVIDDAEVYDGVTGDGEGVVKDVSEYGASTYTGAYYVPGSSGAADYITWSATGSQALGGEHVQTAAIKSGVSSVPAGQNAINVGGALGNVLVQNNNNYGAKTLHCRYTFVESSSPILMRFQYQTSSNGGSPKDTFTMTNTGVTFGDASVSATAPYDINIFQNVDSGVTVIYVNDEILYDARKTGNNLWGSGSHHWQQFRFRTTQADSAFKLVIKNMHHEVYDEKVLLSDVIDYVMLNNKANSKKTNYWWTIDGIKTEWKEIQGAVDGICSVTGDNTNGYVLKPNSVNATNYGYARYFLGSDDQDPLYQSTEDRVLWQTFEYNPTVLTSGQQFRIRGNNGYDTLMEAIPASGTESAYLSVGGNKVPISSDKFYKIDFIVNNKDYEYYILVDGKAVAHTYIYDQRRPLWQTVFTSYTVEESMTLKNVKTTLYDSTVSMDTVVNTLRTRITAPFATDANGYGDFEVENYNCYNADSWRISEGLKFSGGKALAVIAENKTTPYNAEDPTLNLSFTANKAGENTYYMWVRHTASVANQSGQNCFLSLTEDGSYGRFTFTAEQNAPQWICLGNVTVAQGETGFVRVRERQQNHIAFDRYVITTDANFVPTDAYYQISPGASSTAYKAPAFVNGRTSFEAENTTYSSPYQSYTSTFMGTYGSASNYSNSKGISVSSDYSTSFNKSGDTAPNIEFNFTPTTDGSKYLWARIYSTSVNKDIAISVNCSNYVQFSPSKADELYWQLIYVIDGAQANLPINVRMYNVAGGYAIDKFAVSESVFDTPTGKSDWTTTSSTLPSTYSPTVTQSEVTALSHPRIYFTSSEVNTVKNALSATENAAALSAHNANVARGKNGNFTGALAVVPGVSNSSAYLLGAVEALALEYALKGDTTAGQKAVSSAINYVTTVSYAGINSEELPRVAGNDIAVLSRVYDWCYNLFTAEQRTKLIDRCIEIAYQFELGWPPANLSSVTGFGAEGSLQSHLLTFAIAVADERPDIYNYVVGRIENEYIPARKIMYASGESLQGSRYGTYRGQHDLNAALLLSTIGYGNNVYGEGLKDLVNWYIYARRPDGMLFVDGDDTNNGKTAGEYYTVGHMQRAFVIAARLFSDPYIKNEAKKATKDFTEFEYGESYLSPAAFLAINRPGVTTTAENGYPLSKFFDYPNGNIIARTGWNTETSVTDNTAVAFMKSGNVNISNHQHLDAGNFQLYYKGILANDPVYYNDYSSEYMNMYAKRSVAHNTVLVRDNVSRSLNGHSIADGGQVPVSAPTNASGIKATTVTEAYDFGGDDVNQPDYSYLKADLTGAYSSSSVSDYNRSFMFLNMYDEETPAALVVFDRVNTKNTSHKTAWLLHGLNAPQVSGNRSVFSLNENGYTGKMTNDTLLPASSTITTVEDGYVTSGGTKYSSGYTSADGVNESDGYRIEVSPKSQTTLTYYLNVVQLSDAGTEVLTPTLIENDTFAGALIKDRVVLFSKSGDLIGGNTSTEYTFNIADSSGYLCKIAVADVTEGTWEVSYSEDGSEYKVMTTAATNRFGEDKGATISFAGMPGYYKLRRISGEYTQKATEISTVNEIKQLSPSIKYMNDALFVAPRTYTSMSNISAGEYNYTQIIAVYKENVRELLAIKIIDNFSETDKYGDYSELINLEGLPEDIVVKTFLFENLDTLKPITDVGIVKYY